jgi:hypothetical protein
MMKRESDSDPTMEYWVIAFFKSHSKNKTYYRQFMAAGFYEAFDIAMSYSEKTSYQILWYKEKRKCDPTFTALGIPLLESFCTFCNKEFNDIEPIKCNYEKNDSSCKSEFCSIECMQEHFYFKHVR